MAETIIIVALILALIGQGLYLIQRGDSVLREERASRARREEALLDRIQAPNVEAYHAVRREDPPEPVGDWRYDETGLVAVDLSIPDDSE